MVDKIDPKPAPGYQETLAQPLGEPLPGTAYRLIERLGAGGMGQVFRGIHVELGREVAIKLLQPKLADDHNAMERLKREARAAAQLGNPHIVDIYDLGVSEDGRPYVVMKLVPGQTLKEVIDADSPMRPARMMRLLRQLSEALKDAHEAGVIHRDLKPENVIVSDAGPRERVTILDFGIARRIEDVDKRLTIEGEMIGTAGYMAPEQALAKTIDARADQYALAVMIYEMLCGAFPFEGDSALRIIASQLTQPPQPIHSQVDTTVVPGALCDAVMRAMAKNPDERFDDVIFFANACAEALATGESALRTMAVSAVRPPAAKGRGPLVLGGLIVAALSVGTVIFLKAPEEPPPPSATPTTPSALVVGGLETPTATLPSAASDAKGTTATAPAGAAPQTPGSTGPSPKEPAPAALATASGRPKATTRPKKIAPKGAKRPKKTPKRTVRAPAKPPPTGKEIKPATPPGKPDTPAAATAASVTPAVKEPPAATPVAPTVVAVTTPAPKPVAPPPPPPSPPKLVIDDIQVAGGASKSQIRRVVKKTYGKMRACVSSLSGLRAGLRATVKFSIDADGFFGDWSTTGPKPLAKCAQKTLRRVNRLGRRPDTGGIWVTVTLRMEGS